MCGVCSPRVGLNRRPWGGRSGGHGGGGGYFGRVLWGMLLFARVTISWGVDTPVLTWFARLLLHELLKSFWSTAGTNGSNEEKQGGRHAIDRRS